MDRARRHGAPGGRRRAPPALAEIRAPGKPQVQRDGDKPLAEAGAIVEHVGARSGNGRLSLVARLAGDGTRWWAHDLHAATVVGDTVGDPFKDTSSVAMNPVIKFTTLFGLLAVELAVSLTADGQQTLVLILLVSI